MSKRPPVKEITIDPVGSESLDKIDQHVPQLTPLADLPENKKDILLLLLSDWMRTFTQHIGARALIHLYLSACNLNEKFNTSDEEIKEVLNELHELTGWCESVEVRSPVHEGYREQGLKHALAHLADKPQ